MVNTYNPPASAPLLKTLGSVFGLCGGLMAPIIGSVFAVISWFVDPTWHGISLHLVSTALFVLTFPLLLLGAHCLDLLEKD